MYPLVTWSKDKIVDRIDSLNRNEFYYESVVASAQTVERLLKRTIRSELASRGQTLHHIDGTLKLKLVKAETLSDIEASMKKHCQSVDAMKGSPWRLAVKPKIGLSMAEVIDSVAGANAWQTYMSNKTLRRYSLHISVLTAMDHPISPDVAVPFGLNSLRHRLVHAANAIDINLVRHHAGFGKHLVEALLDPDCGLTSLNLRDPQKATRMKKI